MAKRAPYLFTLLLVSVALSGCGVGTPKRVTKGGSVICPMIAIPAFHLGEDFSGDAAAIARVEAWDVTADDGAGYHEKLTANFAPDNSSYWFQGPWEADGNYHVTIKEGSTILYDDVLNVTRGECGPDAADVPLNLF